MRGSLRSLLAEGPLRSVLGPRIPVSAIARMFSLPAWRDIGDNAIYILMFICLVRRSPIRLYSQSHTSTLHGRFVSSVPVCRTRTSLVTSAQNHRWAMGLVCPLDTGHCCGGGGCVPPARAAQTARSPLIQWCLTHSQATPLVSLLLFATALARLLAKQLIRVEVLCRKRR